jgi:hypothetical protein
MSVEATLRSDMSLTSAELCSSVAGVSFRFVRGDAGAARGLVLAEALELAFGATGDPSSWLSTFQANQQQIVACAERRYAERTEDVVVLRSTDF